MFLLLYSCRKTKDSRSFLHGNSNMSNGCFGQFVWKLNSNIYHRRNIYFATDAFNFAYWSSGISSVKLNMYMLPVKITSIVQPRFNSAVPKRVFTGSQEFVLHHMRADSSCETLVLKGFTCSFLQISITNISSMILQKVQQHDSTVCPTAKTRRDKPTVSLSSTSPGILHEIQ